MGFDKEKYDAPKKALVRGTISYLESQGLPVNKSAIFRHFELSRSQGYAALSIPVSKRNDPSWEETRGRPPKIPEADQAKMERILWNPMYEDMNLNWTGLAKEAGISMECNMRTLHRAMGTLGYRRCLGCGTSWMHKRTREKRVDWARKMMETYAQPGDWRFVRFSCELHFGFGLDGKMRLIPRNGEKYCEECSEMDEANWPRDLKRVHCWGSIGFGFKSELVFYEESTSPNGVGTLSMQDYCDKILEKQVKPWIQAQGSSSFILEEDSESFAHGSLSKVNIAQKWKESHGLRYHFTCGDSPDLSPLDSLWPAHKQWTLAEGVKDWDDDEKLREKVREGWEKVDLEMVNRWVDFMPQRLRQVVETDGRLVTW